VSRLQVAIPGATGKMGRMLVKVVAESTSAELIAAVARSGSPHLGQDAGLLAGLPPVGVPVVDHFERALEGEVLIDFTAPAATASIVARAAEHGVAVVIGTTGLSEAALHGIEQAAKRVPIVLSANMSLGVNLLFGLLSQAASALGDTYDVEIVELHHRQKRDAPSGTALAMAQVLAEALHRDLESVATYRQPGDLGPRPTSQIGISAVRGGDIVGDHTVYFCGLGERLEFTHRASSRETFARGALRAAEWLRGRQPGLYNMQDVLGLQ
jgi:4-hydroxy-tetrahydrodipicolinate reductase